MVTIKEKTDYGAKGDYGVMERHYNAIKREMD